MCSAAVATAGLGGFDESTTADSTAPHEFTTDGNNSTSGKDSALVLLKKFTRTLFVLQRFYMA
jgi:hypothetical protein